MWLVSTTALAAQALENKGTTPAYDVVYETWIEILPFPFDDFTPRADYFKCPHNMVLYPTEPMALNIPIQREVSAEEMHAVLDLQLYVCIRIHVTYRVEPRIVGGCSRGSHSCWRARSGGTGTSGVQETDKYDGSVSGSCCG